MQIPYLASNFPTPTPPALSGNNSLACSWTDIVWSAVTAGKPGASHLLAHRWHSLADIVIRTHTIYANLKQSGNHVCQSSLYKSLDPTEKGAASYFLGMTMAKLFAAKLLNVPWLFHVSQLPAIGPTVNFVPGQKTRPDLIGLRQGSDWVVIEAKGRTNGFDSVALAKAKLQAQSIAMVNGNPPLLKVALQVYFDPTMKVRIDDPPEKSQDAVDINLDIDAALSQYYATAEAVTLKSTSRETVLGNQYTTRFDEDSGITIGLESSILEQVLAGKFTAITSQRRKPQYEVTKIDERSAVYSDGFYVSLDTRWSKERMSLEPVER